MNLKIVAIISLFYQVIVISGRGLPTFRIIAPQNICDLSSSNSSITSDVLNINTQNLITINFQPRHDEKFNYNFQIFFKTIDTFRSQRRTLEVWRSIRDLERRINFQDSSLITEQNMVTIKKSELIPGIVYTFHVTGLTEKGFFSKAKNFTIRYPSKGALKEDPKSVNFMLFGSESTYANIPYILVADVLFCYPRFDYYLNWDILGIGEKYQKYLRNPSSTLKLPSNVLEGGTTYQVDVTLLRVNDSKEIARDYMTLEVVRRGFEVAIFPTRVKAATHEPVTLEVIITDYDNTPQSYEVYWRCIAGNKLSCDDHERLKSRKIQISFEITGKYVMLALVKSRNLNQSASTEIDVDSRLPVTYEFDNVPNLIIPEKGPFQFSLNINNLTSNCKGEWISVEERGYLSFASENYKAKLERFTVDEYKGTYLAELINSNDFGKSKTTELFVPEASNEWKGFTGDGKYKFRMSITCPLIESRNSEIDEKIAEEKSLFEFIVKTNSSPNGSPLEINPKTGYAMKTNFIFSTIRRKEKIRETPLSYEFIFEVDKIPFITGKYYEHRVVETKLPYSENAIKTKYKVCNTKGACSIIVGPDIHVKQINITNELINLKQNEIIYAFQRMDFTSGLYTLLSSLITFKKLASPSQMDEFRNFTLTLLSKEIDKQSELPNEEFYLKEEDILIFIKIAKDVIDVCVGRNDSTLTQQLLDLLDSIAEDVDNTGALNDLSTEMIEFRKKRQTQKDVTTTFQKRSIVDEEYVNVSLELMERILESLKGKKSEEKKKKVTSKLSNLLMNMCKSDRISKTTATSRYIRIDLYKLPSSEIIGRNFSITKKFSNNQGYGEKDSFTLTLNFPDLQIPRKKFCIAITQFSEDYNEEMESFPINNVNVYDITTLPTKLLKLDEGRLQRMTLTYPKSLPNIQCLIWSDDRNNWSSRECQTRTEEDENSNFYCLCNRFGYLKLQNTTQISPSTSISFSTMKTITSGGTSIPTRNTIPVVTTAKSLIEQSILSSRNYTRNSTTGPAAIVADNLATSTLNYAIPFALFISLIFLSGGYLLYQRRRQQNISLNDSNIMVIEPRKQDPGIKYAKFHDEYLMSGNI